MSVDDTEETLLKLPILDIDTINDLRKLDDGSTESIVNELGELLLAQVPESINEIKIAQKANEPDKVKKIAHRLKSSSAGLGAKRLSKLFEWIELGTQTVSLLTFIERLDREFLLVKEKLQVEMTRKI